jgi:cytochrome c-type biogenesis protein
MNDPSLAAAFIAGLVSFLSPCVLPLVPGYISMLSGIGMEQLRKGEQPRGLLGSALSFCAGLSVVFIALGASASAIGRLLKENRNSLAPVAGALVLLFGLHLLGVLAKLSMRVGIILGSLLAAAGVAALVLHAPPVLGIGALHLFCLSLIAFFGPSLTRWLNRDVHLRQNVAQPGMWSAFFLGFAFAFGWSPCLGPILGSVLALAEVNSTIAHGVLLLAVYSAGLTVPFLLTALEMSRFLQFYQSFRKYLHAVELFSGALLVFVGSLVFLNRLTWLTGKLSILSVVTDWLERPFAGQHGPLFWSVVGLIIAVIVVLAAFRYGKIFASMDRKKTLLVVATVVAIIVVTIYADKRMRLTAASSSNRIRHTGVHLSGAPAPELTLKDLDGKNVELAQLKGKVVLVNFWATWCEPCRFEIPWLINMQQKYGAKGFTVLGVAMDEEGRSVVAPFVDKERFDVNGSRSQMNYPIVIGNDAAADKFGGLLGYPTSVLIDRDGHQIKRITGIISEEEISNLVESQL